MDKELKFPAGFMWGSATSAHQVEGGNNNDWTEWEKSENRIEALRLQGLDPQNFISGRACDSYNRYEEDFDIARQLNHNTHRFSIEWSRIEPEEGRFDDRAMDHYLAVIEALRKRGIEPIVTLWHFTNPIWFARKGGFLNPKSSEYFSRYACYVAQKLDGKARWLITFNEAGTVYAGFAYLLGLWPPQYKSLYKTMRVIKNIRKAHRSAYKAIKSTSHNVIIGTTSMLTYVVYGRRFYEKIIGRLFNYLRNFYFLDKTARFHDFIGVDYYHVDRIRRFGNFLSEGYEVLPKQQLMPEMDWEFYPQGLYDVLKDLKKRFNKPVLIAENGIADSTDQKRSKFMTEHLYWVWRAIQDGVDVRGYIYWSLLDNFEWAKGFEPRFGLVEIGYATFSRKIRPSAFEYAKICKTNQLDIG